MIYLIGSLRNPNIPLVAARLREEGFHVFDDWYAAGPKADDHWQAYERERERSYVDALMAPAAQNVVRFDKLHLDMSDTVVLVMPAGKSGHLELGYSIGRGKKAYVLFDREPERWDVMYALADGVFFSDDTLIEELHGR